MTLQLCVILHVTTSNQNRFLCRRYVYKYVNNLESILGFTSAQIHKMLGIKPLNDEEKDSLNIEVNYPCKKEPNSNKTADSEVVISKEFGMIKVVVVVVKSWLLVCL